MGWKYPTVPLEKTVTRAGNTHTFDDVSEQHEDTKGLTTLRQTRHYQNHVNIFALLWVKITQWHQNQAQVLQNWSLIKCFLFHLFQKLPC